MLVLVLRFAGVLVLAHSVHALEIAARPVNVDFQSCHCVATFVEMRGTTMQTPRHQVVDWLQRRREERGQSAPLIVFQSGLEQL